MRKHRLRFIVDAVTLLAALSMTATGLLLKFVMPPGSRGGKGLELWGLGRHDWGDLHLICSAVLGGLLLLQVILPWHWIGSIAFAVSGRDAASPAAIPVANTTRRRRCRCVLLLCGATAVILGFLWIASVSLTRKTTGLGEGDCTCTEETGAAGTTQPAAGRPHPGAGSNCAATSAPAAPDRPHPTGT